MSMSSSACAKWDFDRPSRMQPLFKSELSGAVVTRREIKCMMGFRECSRLVAIARENGCVIRLAAGKKSGSTESMLSLIQMGLREGTSVVLSIQGEDSRAAFHECVKVLDGETSN